MGSATQNLSAICPGGQVRFSVSSSLPYDYISWQESSAGWVMLDGYATAPSTFDPNNVSFVLTANFIKDGNVVDTASVNVKVLHPLLLLLDIFQHELGLDDDHITLWNQKDFIPKDNSLYVVASVVDRKIMANNLKQDSAYTNNVTQTMVNAMVDINLISKSDSAIYGTDDAVAALTSVYARNQMTANGFKISTVPVNGPRDVSIIDGTAIPYRFVFTVRVIYQSVKTSVMEYFDTIQGPTVEAQA